MPETTILFAQSVVVLAFVYFTAILVVAVIHFFSLRKEAECGVPQQSNNAWAWEMLRPKIILQNKIHKK